MLKKDENVKFQKLLIYLVSYFDIMMLRIFNKWEMNKNALVPAFSTSLKQVIHNYRTEME